MVDKHLSTGVGRSVGREAFSSSVSMVYKKTLVVKPKMTDRTAGVVATFHSTRGKSEQTDDIFVSGGGEIAAAVTTSLLVWLVWLVSVVWLSLLCCATSLAVARSSAAS
jgi:hypothetical protein